MLQTLLPASYTFFDLLIVVLAFVLIAAVLWAIGNLVIGAVLFIFSGGNSDRVTNAFQRIRYSVIGIVVLVGIMAIIPIALNLLTGSNHNYSMLFTKVKDVIDIIVIELNGGNTSTTIYTNSPTIDFTNL